MPLPDNTTLSLQTQLRPGGKPKRAMVVRMTEEALDSLQQLQGSEQLEFEFGDRPGIHIRTAFFPLNIQTGPEESDLYIRTTTAARPSAPLKLSAALAGRIRIERSITTTTTPAAPAKVTKRIADEQEKEKHKIKLLNPPVKIKTVPVVVSTAYAKNGNAPLNNKSLMPSGRNTPIVVPTRTHSRASSSTSMRNGGSPAPSGIAPANSLSKDEEAALRTKLIHFLALGSKPFSAVQKEVGGDEAQAAWFLREIADQDPIPKNSTIPPHDIPWRLKPKSWLLVRPYDYPSYSEEEQILVSRSARTWFSSNKIQSTDPLWEHVRFRSGKTSPPAPAPAAAPQKAKKAASAAAAKKPRQSDVRMKSEVGMSSSTVPAVPAPTASRASSGASLAESAKASLKVPDTDGEREEGELSASSTPPPPRGMPDVPVGSQSRKPAVAAKKSTMPKNANVFLPPRPMTPPLNVNINGTGPANGAASGAAGANGGLKRSTNGPVDARTKRRPPPEQSARATPLPPLPPPVASQNKKTSGVKRESTAADAQKAKEKAAARELERGRQREREENKAERERDRARRERERDLKQQERELAKGKEREAAKEKAAAALEASRKAAAAASVLARQDSGAGTSKKRARAEVSPAPSGSESESSDFDLEPLKLERKRQKEALRGSGAEASSSKVSSKYDRAHERERDRERDVSVSRRAASPPPRKRKREERESLPPASQDYLHSTQGRSSSQLNASTSRVKASSASSSRKYADDGAERRAPKKVRRSPVYTSDEEEGEEAEEKPKRPLKASSSSTTRIGKVRKSEAEPERRVSGAGSEKLKASAGHVPPASAGNARSSHALPHKPPPPASAPVVSSSSRLSEQHSQKRRSRSRSPVPRRDHERDRDRGRDRDYSRARSRSRSRSPPRRRARRDDDAMDVDMSPPASLRGELREEYSNIYSEYLSTFCKLVEQKKKINDVLQRRNDRSSNSGSASDEPDDLLTPDEIEQLHRLHGLKRGQLEKIRAQFA